jgi:tetratricopeptide (TPR) repeat protein
MMFIESAIDEFEILFFNMKVKYLLIGLTTILLLQGCKNHIGIRHLGSIPEEKLESRKIKKEIRKYNDSISKEPKKAEYYVKRGELRHSIADYDEAINDFDLAIEIDRNNAIYYFRRGKSKSFCDDKIGAMKDFNKSIELDSTNGDVYFSRGTVKQFSDKKDNKGALEDYSKAITLGNAQPCVYYYRAEIYLERKENENACKDFKDALDKGCDWELTIKNQIKLCE